MGSSDFLKDITDFIEKSVCFDNQKKDILHCGNTFRCSDQYAPEKEILERIRKFDYKNTKKQGDDLEDLIKSLFGRLTLISSLSVTGKDTALGQIDISLVVINNTIYEIWGMTGDIPLGLIGECKNYKSEGVSRPEIEKTCWRCCKGSALSFFIGRSYKSTAIREISDFNLYRGKVLSNSAGVYIVPITIGMLEIIIEKNLNFCYFIKWAISTSKHMSISNYLSFPT